MSFMVCEIILILLILVLSRLGFTYNNNNNTLDLWRLSKHPRSRYNKEIEEEKKSLLTKKSQKHSNMGGIGWPENNWKSWPETNWKRVWMSDCRVLWMRLHPFFTLWIRSFFWRITTRFHPTTLHHRPALYPLPCIPLWLCLCPRLFDVNLVSPL